MRKEGFNIRATKLDGSNFVQVENSGQGGAGVAASWVGSFGTLEVSNKRAGWNKLAGWAGFFFVY